MDEKQRAFFRELCVQYLSELSLVDLRSYGRYLQLTAPTRLKKIDLIHEIVDVLCEKKISTRTKRGAPIKNNYFKADIPLKIEEIKRNVFETNVNGLREGSKKEETKKAEIKQEHVLLQFSIAVETLNERQKQLLSDFLNSL